MPRDCAYLKLVPPVREASPSTTTFPGFYALVSAHQAALARHDIPTARRLAREIAFRASEFYLMTVQLPEVISAASL